MSVHMMSQKQAAPKFAKYSKKIHRKFGGHSIIHIEVVPTQKQEAPYNYKTPPLPPFSLFPPHALSMLRLMIAFTSCLLLHVVICICLGF
jgi:hypothetical protein